MRASIVVVALVVSGCEDNPKSEGEKGVELAKIGDEPRGKAGKEGAADGDAKNESKARTERAPSDTNVVAALYGAKSKTACIEAQRLLSAAEMFSMTDSRPPKDVAELEARGMIQETVDDPWGNDFAIEGPDLKVTSGGPDEKMGTADDIVVAAGDPDPCK